MDLYFARHEAKQYINEKTIEFGDKLWVMATPLSYCIGIIRILVKMEV